MSTTPTDLEGILAGEESKPAAAVSKPAKAPAIRTRPLEKRLSDLFVQLGSGIALADQTCGLAIVQGGPELASALDALAKENKSVARGLEKMLTGGAWGGVVLATFPILTTVFAHHGLLPTEAAKMMGIEVSAKKRKPIAVVPESDGKGNDGDRNLSP